MNADFIFESDLIVCRTKDGKPPGKACKAQSDETECDGKPEQACSARGNSDDNQSENQGLKRFNFYTYRKYRYRYKHSENDEDVVPPGEPTDFASVPALFRVFVSKIGYHTEAAVVHDYLYRSQEAQGKTASDKKRYADDLFRAAIGAAHDVATEQANRRQNGRWKARAGVYLARVRGWLAYATVASWGHCAFNNDRTKKARLQGRELGHGLLLAIAGVFILFPVAVLAGALLGLLSVLMFVALPLRYVGELFFR